MLDVTPDPPNDETEIRVGDGVPLRWTLDVDADPAEVVFDVWNGPVFTGDDLTKEDLGDGSFRFSVGRLYGSTVVLRRTRTYVEFRHEADPETVDRGVIRAEP